MSLYNLAAERDPYATKALTDKLYGGEIDQDSFQLGLNLAAGNPGGDETIRNVVSSYLDSVRSNPRLALDANRRDIVAEYVNRGNIINGTNYDLNEAIGKTLSLNLQDRQQKMAEQQGELLSRSQSSQYYGTQDDPEKDKNDVFGAIEEASKLEKAIAVYNERPEIFDLQHVRQLQTLSEKHNIPFDPYPTPEHAVHLGVPGSATKDLENNWETFFDGSSVGSVVKSLVEGAVEGLTTIDIRTEDEKLSAASRADEMARSIGHLAGFIGFGTHMSVPMLGSSAISKAVAKTFPKAAKWVNPQLVQNGVLAQDFVASVLGKAAETGQFYTIAQKMVGGAFNLGVAQGISSWQKGPTAVVDSMLGGIKAGAFFPLLAHIPGGNAAIKKTLGTIAGAAWDGIPAYREQGASPETLYNMLLGGYFGWKEASGGVSFAQARERIVKESQASYDAGGVKDEAAKLLEAISGRTREDNGDTAYDPGSDGTYKDYHSLVIIGSKEFEDGIGEYYRERGSGLGADGIKPIKFTSEASLIASLEGLASKGKDRAYKGVIKKLVEDGRSGGTSVDFNDLINRLKSTENPSIVDEFVEDFVESIGDTNLGLFSKDSPEAVGTIIFQGSGSKYDKMTGSTGTIEDVIGLVDIDPIVKLKDAVRSSYGDGGDKVIETINSKTKEKMNSLVSAIITGSSQTQLVFTDDSGAYIVEGASLKKVTNPDTEIIPSKMRTLIIGSSDGSNSAVSGTREVIESIEKYGNIGSRIKRGGGNPQGGSDQHLNIRSGIVNDLAIGSGSERIVLSRKGDNIVISGEGYDNAAINSLVDAHRAHGMNATLTKDPFTRTVTIGGMGMSDVIAALSAAKGGKTPGLLAGTLERVSNGDGTGDPITIMPGFEDVREVVSRNNGTLERIDVEMLPIMRGWNARSANMETPIITIQNSNIVINWSTKFGSNRASVLDAGTITRRAQEFAEKLAEHLENLRIKTSLTQKDRDDTSRRSESVIDKLVESRMDHDKSITLTTSGTDMSALYEAFASFSKDYIVSVKGVGRVDGRLTRFTPAIGTTMESTADTSSVYGAAVTKANNPIGARSIAGVLGFINKENVATYAGGSSTRDIIDYSRVREVRLNENYTIFDYLSNSVPAGNTIRDAATGYGIDDVSMLALSATHGGTRHVKSMLDQLKFVSGSKFDEIVKGVAAQSIGEIDKFFKSSSMRYSEGAIEYRPGESSALRKIVFGVKENDSSVTMHDDTAYTERANSKRAPEKNVIDLTKEEARLFEIGDVIVSEYARDNDSGNFMRAISTAELGDPANRARVIIDTMRTAANNGLIYFGNDSVEGRPIFVKPDNVKVELEWSNLIKSSKNKGKLTKLLRNVSEEEVNGTVISSGDLANYNIAEELLVKSAAGTKQQADLNAKARILAMVKSYGEGAALSEPGNTLGWVRDYIKRSTTLGPKNIAMTMDNFRLAATEVEFIRKLKEEKANGRFDKRHDLYLEFVDDGGGRATGGIAMLREAYKPIWDAAKASMKFDPRGFSVGVLPTITAVLDGTPLTDGVVYVSPRILAAIHRLAGGYRDIGGIQKLVMKKLFGDTYFYGKLSFQAQTEATRDMWNAHNHGKMIPDIIFDDSALKSIKPEYIQSNGMLKLKDIDYGGEDYLFFGSGQGELELGFSEHEVSTKIPTQLFQFIYERSYGGNNQVSGELGSISRSFVELMKERVNEMTGKIKDRKSLIDTIKNDVINDPDISSELTQLIADGVDISNPVMTMALNKYMLAKVIKNTFNMSLDKNESGVSILSDSIIGFGDKVYDESGRRIDNRYLAASGKLNLVRVKSDGKERNVMTIGNEYVILPQSYVKNGYKVGDKIIIDKSPIPKGSNITGLEIIGFSGEENGNAIKVSHNVTFKKLMGDLDIDKVAVFKVGTGDKKLDSVMEGIHRLVSRPEWSEAWMDLNVDDVAAVEEISKAASGKKWYETKDLILGTINASLGMDAVGKLSSMYRFRSKVEGTMKDGVKIGDYEIRAMSEFDTVEGMRLELTDKAYNRLSSGKWKNNLIVENKKYYIKDLRLGDYYDLMLNIAVDDLKKGGVLSRKTYGDGIDNPLYYSLKDARSRMFKVFDNSGAEVKGDLGHALRYVLSESLFAIEERNIRLEADLIRMKDPKTRKDYDLQALQRELVHYVNYHKDSIYRNKIIRDAIIGVTESQDAKISSELRELFRIPLKTDAKYEASVTERFKFSDRSGFDDLVKRFFSTENQSSINEIMTVVDKEVKQVVSDVTNIGGVIASIAKNYELSSSYVADIFDIVSESDISTQNGLDIVTSKVQEIVGISDNADRIGETEVVDIAKNLRRGRAKIFALIKTVGRIAHTGNSANVIRHLVREHDIDLGTIGPNSAPLISGFIADSIVRDVLVGDRMSQDSLVKLRIAKKIYDTSTGSTEFYSENKGEIDKLFDVAKSYESILGVRKLVEKAKDFGKWSYGRETQNINNDALSSMVMSIGESIGNLSEFNASGINASRAASRKAIVDYVDKLTNVIAVPGSTDFVEIKGRIGFAKRFAEDVIEFLGEYTRDTYTDKSISATNRFKDALEKRVLELSNKNGYVKTPTEEKRNIYEIYKKIVSRLDASTNTSKDYVDAAADAFVEFASMRASFKKAMPIEDAKAMFLEFVQLTSYGNIKVKTLFGRESTIFDAYTSFFSGYKKTVSDKLSGLQLYNRALEREVRLKEQAVKGSSGSSAIAKPVLSPVNREYRVDIAGKKVITREKGSDVVLADFSRVTGDGEAVVNELLTALSIRSDIIKDLPGIIKGLANNPDISWSSEEARDAARSGLITRASDFRRIVNIIKSVASSDPNKRYVAGLLSKGYALPRRVAESISRLSVSVSMPFMKDGSVVLMDPISMLSKASAEAELQLNRSSEDSAKEITSTLSDLGNNLSDSSRYAVEEGILFRMVEGKMLNTDAEMLRADSDMNNRIHLAAGRVKKILESYKKQLKEHYNTSIITLPDGTKVSGGLNGVIDHFNKTFGMNINKLVVDDSSFMTKDNYMPHRFFDDKVLMSQIVNHVKVNSIGKNLSEEEIQDIANDIYNEHKGLGAELLLDSKQLSVSNSMRHMQKRSLNLEGYSNETGRVLLEYNKEFYNKINRDILSLSSIYINMSIKTGNGNLGKKLSPLLERMEKDSPGSVDSLAKYLNTFGKNIVGVPSSDNASFFGLNINDKNVAANIEKYAKMWFGDDVFTKRGMTSQRFLEIMSQHEGQFQVMSLLAFPKSIIGNYLGANKNIIKEIGFKKWSEASSIAAKISSMPDNLHGIEDILRNYADYDPSSETQKTLLRQLRNTLNTPGILASMTKYEAELTEMYGAVKVAKFKELRASGKSVMSSLSESGIGRNAWEKMVSVGAYGMKLVEHNVRTKSFVSGLMQARSMKLPAEAAIRHGLRMVEKTQFFYNAASTPEFRNSAMGRILTRFQPWAWQQWAFESDIITEARDLGFDPDTPEYKRFVRASSINASLLAIAAFLPFSMFGNLVPPPFSYAADLARSIFGDDDEEKKKAAMYNASRALSTAVGPTLNNFLVGPALALATENFSYNPYLVLPFGRAISGVVNTFKYPQFSPEIWTGAPVMSVKKAFESNDDGEKKQRTIAAIKRKPTVDETDEEKADE